MKRSSLMLLAGACLLFAPKTPLAQTPPGEDSYRLRMGFSAQSLTDTGTGEAVSLTRKLTERIATRTLGVKDAQTTVFREIAAMKEALVSGRLDIVALTGGEYVRLSAEVDLDPALVPSRRSGDSFEVLLVARRESGLSSFADLKDLSLVTSRDQSRMAQAMWLETEVLRVGYPSAPALLLSVKEARSPSQAVLSVFFGQADACLVTAPAMEIASEMNPQLSTRLAIVARTAPLASGVVAFRSGYPKAARDRVVEVMAQLHLDPEGRQLLGIFGTEKMTPFRPEFLEGSRALLLENQRQLARRDHESRLRKGSVR